MAKGIERFIESIAVQTAVYWGSPQNDGYGGKTYAAPVEIDVRWDEAIQEITAPTTDDGKVRVLISKAKIFVTEDVSEGGRIVLSTLDELNLDSDLQPDLSTTHEIIRFTKVPMIKKTDEFVRLAYI